MMKNNELDVKAMIDDGSSPAYILKSIARQEKAEKAADQDDGYEKISTRRLAVKDLSVQNAEVESTMKAAIK